jgi:hypothetical protein
MTRLFVRHAVSDYSVWRKGYDENQALRDDNGVKADGVYVSVDDANDVTVYHDFDSLEAAQAYVALPDLKAVMDRIGVVGAPTIWITSEGQAS